MFKANIKDSLKLFLSFWIYWLILFFAVRLVFVLFHFDQMGKDVDFGDIVLLFFHGIRLDLSATGYIMVIPSLLFISLFFLSFNKVRYILRIYFVGLIAFCIFLSAVDLNLYSHWGFRLDATPLLYLKTPGAFLDSMTWYDYFIPFVFIIIVGGGLIYLFFNHFFEVSSVQYSKIKTPLFFLLLFPFLIIPIRGSFDVAPINIGTVYFHKNLIMNHAAINVPWNVIYSITNYNSGDDNLHYLKDEETNLIFSELLQSKDTTDYVLKNKNPEILLIILESFTSKLINRVEEGVEITPYFNTLLRQGIYFPNFYATGDRSDKGIVSVISGYPAQPTTSIINNHAKVQTLSSIISEVKKGGYASKFYYGGDIDFANFKSYFISAGIDEMVIKDDFPSETYSKKWGVFDHIVLDSIYADLIREHSSRFTIFFSLSNHEPFDVPNPVFNENPTQDQRFFNGANYTDRSLEKFIERLKKEKIWENLLVIITADHGHRLPGMTEVYLP
ncbi:MAG: sulfatase-like hydrolase/transferase, partial [Cyclobacteriaceae bacterium]|nr:sulfatase-like hydrolase/transferase [Cyclobacteriaceae bacterium]